MVKVKFRVFSIEVNSVSKVIHVCVKGQSYDEDKLDLVHLFICLLSLATLVQEIVHENKDERTKTKKISIS